MGGMQALEWSVAFPHMSQSGTCLAATHYQSAQGIAFNQVGRQAIYQDPNWNKGDYYGSTPPSMGLALARMIGFITYLSERKMHEKFGRKLQEKDALSFAFESEFQVESYLRHQGVKFVARFDANAYLYLTKAIDYFDLKLDYGAEQLADVFEKTKSDFLMISFTSDWLDPSDQMREMINALRANGKNVIYMDIETHHGHDAFLLPNKTMNEAISHFLKREQMILDDKIGK